MRGSREWNEGFAVANRALELMTDKRNALDIKVAELEAQLSALREAAQAVTNNEGARSLDSLWVVVPIDLIDALKALLPETTTPKSDTPPKTT